MNKQQRFGYGLLSLFTLLAIAAPLVTKHAPLDFDGPSLSLPTIEYWFGTNELGQDIFSQLIYGIRTSLFVSFMVAGISTFISVMLGLWAGYHEKADQMINGLANVIMVIPNLLLVLIVVAFTKGSLWVLILTLAFLSWPGYMRIIRSQVLTLREREFVKAAITFQGKHSYILWRHILPQLYPVIRAKLLITAQMAVITEASLSFLGLGNPNTVSWGMMLHDAFQASTTFMNASWQWLLIPPTSALLLLTINLSLIANGDQRKRKTKKRSIGKLEKQPNEKEIENKSSVSDLEQENNIVTVHHVTVAYDDSVAVSNVSFSVGKGETCMLVGESGAGKSTIANAIMGMLGRATIEGSIFFEGKNLLKMNQKERQKLRWVDISMVFQDARQALNPLLTIGEQINEVLIVHSSYRLQAAQRETEHLLAEVGLDKSVTTKYPHEISGGMCSRAVIAMALANKPKLIIADEPTSALDPVLRKKILELLKDKIETYEISLLFITHDIGIVAELADQVVVMKDGNMIENRNVFQWFNQPQTDYSKKLLSYG